MKALLHIMGSKVSDEKDKVEERPLVKQTLTINGYPECLINSTPTIQPPIQVMVHKRLSPIKTQETS